MFEILGYIASLVMGVTLGLLGGGGSILTVPILVYLFALPATAATLQSLFVVGFTALIGATRAIKRNEFDLKTLLSFAPAGLAGVYFSRGILLPRLPDPVFSIATWQLGKDSMLLLLFAVLMIFAAFKMISPRSKPKPESPKRALDLPIRGFLVGVVTGLIGAGGGFLITPALHFFAGLNMRRSIGTSLGVIALNSLFGFAVGGLSAHAPIAWTMLATITTLAVFGIILGSLMSKKLSEQTLKKAFGWMVLVMGTAILLERLAHH